MGGAFLLGALCFCLCLNHIARYAISTNIKSRLKEKFINQLNVVYRCSLK